MMKATRWIVAAAVVVVSIIVIKLTLLAPSVIEVRTASVDRGPVEETITNTRAGTIKVQRRASLSPMMGGLVVALPHREGAKVAAGDLLLKLDDRAQRAQHELAVRDVRAAGARSEEACLAAVLADKELVRVLALHERGIASDQSMDTLHTERERTRAACNAARAAVELAEAQVAAAQVQLDFTEVRAPFAGTVAELTTEIGEWITPAPPGVPIPPVIDLLDPASAYVSAPIDEVDAERVRVGQTARVTVDSRPDQEYGARVKRAAPYVLDDLEQNRTVEVEVEFEEPEAVEGILPGTSADVEVILDRREDVLRIPSAALAEGNRVLILASDTLEERTVGVGLKNWQTAEIVAGLAEGDRVVTSRHSTDVRDGARAVGRSD
jgi:HlyD family secretion protein